MRVRNLLTASALAAAALLCSAGTTTAAEPAPPSSTVNDLAHSTCGSATNAAALLGGAISCGR